MNIGPKAKYMGPVLGRASSSDEEAIHEGQDSQVRMARSLGSGVGATSIRPQSLNIIW